MRAVIVCVAKNEERYIREWVDYHLKLGFDHIYVYKNDWGYHIGNKKVTEIDFNGSCQQVNAYNHFISHYGHTCTWAAFIDVDEYICLRKHSHIKLFLNEFHFLDTIAMNWRLFGDNGHTLPNDGVVNRFTKTSISGNMHIKMLIKPTSDVHFESPHSTNKQWVSVNGAKGEGPFNHSWNYDIIQLNHYFCKTKAEFQEKIDKGRPDIDSKRTMKEFDPHNLNEVEDTRASEFYSLPFISCKCITYGRVYLLEEALESFMRQKYAGRKELVIVNDYPLQKLIYDHPEVRIFNLDTTFATIGEKENFAVTVCEGSVIAVWDDDDVGLPNHLTNIAKWFKPGSNILHWSRGIFYNHPHITAITGVGNSGIVYSKEAWQRIGGHPMQNAGYDMTLVQRLHALGGVVFAAPEDEEASWYYMWGGRGYHMSGLGDDVEGRPNVIERHSAYIEHRRQKGEIPTGDIYLDPNWHEDYINLLNQYNAGRIHHTHA